MGCQRIVTDELVEKYVSGQLDMALQEDFEVHLLDCTACLERVEALDSLRAGLEERETAIRSMRPIPAWSRSWAWSGAIAVLFIIPSLLVALLLHRRSHQGQLSSPIAAQQPSPTPLAVTPGLSEPTPLAAPNGTKSNSLERPLHQAVQPVLPEPTPQTSQSGPKSDSEHPNHRTSPPSPPQTNAPVAPQIAENKPAPEAAIPNPSPSASHGKTLSATPQLSEAAALELYQLGEVEPAPYVSSVSTSLPRVSNRSALTSTRLEFDDAMSAYVEQRYRDAARMLENVLRADPKNATARFYLGICMLLNGRPADAIEALSRALQDGEATMHSVGTIPTGPVSPLTQSELYYMGKAHIQIGDLARAQKEMSAAAALPGRLKATAQSLAQRIDAFRKSQAAPGKDDPN